MTRLVMPSFLQEKLNLSSRGAGLVNSLSDILEWIESGGTELPFFPEYTEHGVHHISRVLHTICELMPAPSRQLLAPEDAIVLVLAAVLHDCAMHIREDGFLSLIAPRSEREYAPRLGDQPWLQAWESFFAEARRWDGQMLKSILGDAADERTNAEEYEDLVQYVRRPAEYGDPDRWPRKYRKFVGEFLRRNHGRLAHDIAINGVPGPGCLGLASLPSHYVDLAGLVARSHSMPLRETFPYLQMRYHGRVICHSTHPAYLMVLLRLSDYLDITGERAPESLQAVRRLRSPISVGEWAAHRAVRDVRPDEQDREALYIVAEPEDAKSFFRVQRLLNDLQSELDTSWAVLGEVYSKQADLGLDKFGISLRRIRSNLDDVADFEQSVRYVPARAAFGAADTHLLRLLIKPLYGERPEIGIRELVQNALDAVRELRARYSRQRPEGAPWPVLDNRWPTADVVISVCQRATYEGSTADIPEEWEYWVEVSDRGIGMTADVICNYFLKAGASFRDSDAWRQEFLDDTGRSSVLRSGRFGIGVFASFLLGNAVAVSTRHVTSDHGLRFRATVNDRDVNLIKGAREAVGTSVYVRITADMFGHLTRGQKKLQAWDWYCSDDPRVLRIVSTKPARLPQQYAVPACDRGAAGPWRVFRHRRLGEVHWTYAHEAPGLCCNGLLIDPNWSRAHTLDSALERYVSIRIPKLSLYDADGVLPLNITRTGLHFDPFTQDKELFADITKDFFAFLVGASPTSIHKTLTMNLDWPAQAYVGFARTPASCLRDNTSCWIATEDGTVYLHPFIVREAGLRRLLIGHTSSSWHERVRRLLDWTSTGIVPIHCDMKQLMGDVCHGWLMDTDAPKVLPIAGVRAFIHQRELGRVPSTSRFKDHVAVRPSSHGAWTCYSQGKTPKLERDMLAILDDVAHAEEDDRFLVQIYLDRHSLGEMDTSLFAKLWRKMRMSPMIPYDLDQRASLRSRLPEAIRAYVRLWDEQRRDAVKKRALSL